MGVAAEPIGCTDGNSRSMVQSMVKDTSDGCMEKVLQDQHKTTHFNYMEILSLKFRFAQHIGRVSMKALFDCISIFLSRGNFS